MAEEKGRAKTATEEEGLDLWGKVVELTQTAFRDGNLEEEETWQTVVLIPKGKGEFDHSRGNCSVQSSTIPGGKHCGDGGAGGN